MSVNKSPENPEGHSNYYDPEKGVSYDGHGNATEISPEDWARDGEALIAESEAAAAAPETPAEVDAAAKAATVIVEADTKHELDKAKVGLGTVKGLEEVKTKIGKEFENVVEILKGKSLSGEINIDQLGDGLVFLGGEEAFQKAVEEKLSEADMKALKDILSKSYSFTDDEFPVLLSKIATVATIGLYNEKIKAKYPHILTFDKFKSKAFSLNYRLGFDGDKPTLDLSMPSGFQELYDTHSASEIEKVKAAETAAKADEAAATKAGETAKAQQTRLEELKAHPMGAILVDFFGSEPGGLVDNILNGKNPVFAFLLGGLGVGGFAGGYEAAKKLASKHPKLKGIFDEVESKLKPMREDAAKEAGDKAQETTVTIPPMTDAKFREFLGTETGKIQEVTGAGLQLSKNFKVDRERKIKVDLTHGSVVIPAGKSLNLFVDNKVKGEPALDKEPKTLKGKVIILAGDNDIPKGTIFTKGAKLELV
ncbi:MAG: hypothetical protein O3B47_03430 [bacterium]|nr:hypothetical protein [bacterium]